MNKKVLTLSAALLLSGSLTAVAQTISDKGETTYRSNVVKAPTTDGFYMQNVQNIRQDCYYQLAVNHNTLSTLVTDYGSDTYVLSADRDYATGKIYLTARNVNKAVLTHTLWKIKVTDDPVHGRIYTFVNKETGYELAFDHESAAEMVDGRISSFNYSEQGELSGCISHWAWRTSDEDSYSGIVARSSWDKLYAYYHDKSDHVLGLQAVLKSALSEEDQKISAKLGENDEKTNYIVAVKETQKDANLNDNKWLSIQPIVAGAKVLNAEEINSMIDANGSSAAFENGIGKFSQWTDATNKVNGSAKFTVCKPGTNEPMKFASNPFENAFRAVQSSDEQLSRGNSSPYAGYDILLGTTKGDTTRYLYVSSDTYEGDAFQHIYNGLQVTTEPYRNVVKDQMVEYTSYEAVPYQNRKSTDALGARYHWKVTYYPTQDSVVFEPLNASRMSTIDQQKGEKAWTASSIKDLKRSEWLNTINKGSDSNVGSGTNAGSSKAAGVPVALYAMNFGLESGDQAAFLTVGSAESDENYPINPAADNSDAVAEKKTEKDNPAYVTKKYQAKMKMAVRFNHSYENDVERATLDPGLYFINIKDVKDNKTQTENRVEGAYLVEDMKGHLVYDTQDDAQNFLHMPATQWVVEQLNCQKGDEYNTNKNPQVAIYNREFNSNKDNLDKALFHGQLYRNKKTGHIITLNHQLASSDAVQNVDIHNQNTTLPCEDQYAFENITAKQTPYGYFNEEEAVLRNSTYKLQHLQNMQADKFLGEENGYVKLAGEGTEFELYRAECWTPTFHEKEADFTYTDSIAYGYHNDVVKPLYKTPYKVKVKDENLIDNDHKFLAITNQHKYVIAKESEIENSDELAFAIVYLKENNELEGEHAYGLVNEIEFSKTYGSFDNLKGLLMKASEDGKNWEFYKEENGKEVVYFVYSREKQVEGKLEIENSSLYAKIADLCETTTDAFVLVQTNRPLYRTLDAEYVNNDKKALVLKTIDEQGNEFLYEDSSSELAKKNNLNYLAVENKNVNYTNEGFYVDKVAKSTSVMPQYLLAVGVDSVPSYTYCTEGLHGINPKCGHIATMPGYVEGRYLVNFNDSIKSSIDKLSSHADPFLSSNYIRLGFVEALHVGDTLYVMKDGNKLADYKVADANNTNYIQPSFYDAANEGVVYNKVALDGKHNNVAFSFRETGEGDFMIESNDVQNTAQIGSFAGAWVKIHNNVPVLTQFKNDNGNHNTGDSTDSWKEYADYTTAGTFGEVINQAARFDANFKTKDASTTANEAISATDVVVSATTGAVVVKGAAGKSVVITNILGQTLTSATVSSDNATIAVPAGIAVVAVEGEEAVKVVVK